MNDTVISVLLVEDDANEAGLIQDALNGQAGSRFQLEWVTHLAAAQVRLGTTKVDLVLLDLTLPDSQGIEVYEQIRGAAPHVLILILCSPVSEEIARLAVQRGAQDYMVKGHVSPHWLPRALRYLIERKATRDALRGSEARFRAMSDASPLGIFVSDADGGCIYTNAAYQKISGLGFEQTLGTNWSVAIHPDDRQRVLAEWHHAARALRSSVGIDNEYRLRPSRRARPALIPHRVPLSAGRRQCDLDPPAQCRHADGRKR